MKRTITARIDGITVTAKIDSGRFEAALVSGEVEKLRDELADRLGDALAGLVYLHTSRTKVIVK